MVKKAAVPDAWDDDWEAQADKAESSEESASKTPEIAQEPQAKVTKAERLAKHAETNRQIWQNAEEPETFHFLAARDPIPLKSDFKPALKVLSRKPAPKLVQRFDPVTGVAKMTMEEEEDEVELKVTPSPEQLRLRAQREREEKQKRYDEVRARIMGTSSGASFPGNVTPPAEAGKGRGRGKGNLRTSNDNRPSSQSGSMELFDPNYTPKPGVQIQGKNGDGSRSGASTPREEDQILRAPRGPDPNAKGFGFANRSDKTG